MLTKTRGIVFHHLKYSETSVIAKIYTEEFGLQSYLIKGARRKKSAISSAVFQHLSLVELVAYHKNKSSLQHIKEIQIIHQFSSIPFNIVKSSIILFINELVYKSIREEEANRSLFSFLFNAIQWFDLNEENYINFHLVFAVQLSKFLGFFPRGNYTNSSRIFDLESGCFENTNPLHLNKIEEPLSRDFSKLKDVLFENITDLNFNNDTRSQLLNSILDYYSLHHEGLNEIKSIEVLKTILS